MTFGYDGRYGTNVRPAHKPSTALWAKDPTTAGSDDGTRLTASLINAIVANLREAATRNGVVLVDGSDAILADAIDAAVATAGADLIALGEPIALLADGDGFVRMTDAERSKLAALTLSFRGVYVDLAALVTAVPSASAGDWAILTHGDGAGSTFAVWDSDETPAAWVDTGETGSVPVHSHAIADVTGLQTALDGKAASSHSHPISGVTGLQTALDGKAALTGATFTGDIGSPNVNATTAIKKKGVSGQIITATLAEDWSTGFTTTSGAAVEAWISSEIVKASAQADAAKLACNVIAAVQASRSGLNAGAVLTLETRTYDGSTWSGWSARSALTLHSNAGGSTSTAVSGILSDQAIIDLTGKTKAQLRLLARVLTTASTPSLTLSSVALSRMELL